MHHPTINGEEILALFHELMQPNSPQRVLRLMGQAKLGKSHLLTKVFPGLAQQEQATCRHAILDLRTRSLNELDVLNSACDQLGNEDFERYLAEHRAWSERPRVEASNLQAVLSKIRISAHSGIEESRRIVPHLTRAFFNDLQARPQQPVLFLFDQVDDASDTIRDWLFGGLLVRLAKLSHIRCVVAGSVLPPADSAYKAICRDYELQPVTDIDAYVHFCEMLNISIGNEAIRAVASVLDYSPGLFAEKAKQLRKRNRYD